MRLTARTTAWAVATVAAAACVALLFLPAPALALSGQLVAPAHAVPPDAKLILPVTDYKRHYRYKRHRVLRHHNSFKHRSRRNQARWDRYRYRHQERKRYRNRPYDGYTGRYGYRSKSFRNYNRRLGKSLFIIDKDGVFFGTGKFGHRRGYGRSRYD